MRNLNNLLPNMPRKRWSCAAVASREEVSSSSWSLQTGQYLLRLELLVCLGLALHFPGEKQETLDNNCSVAFLTFSFSGHIGKGSESNLNCCRVTLWSCSIALGCQGCELAVTCRALQMLCTPSKPSAHTEGLTSTLSAARANHSEKPHSNL